MFNLFNYPFLILVIAFPTFWGSALIGGWLHKRAKEFGRDSHEDFQFVIGGTVTLLVLIVGFTFSMALNRYDMRKNYEEQEANAIGTEYVRADLLPASDGARVQTLLKSYLNQRILHYETWNWQRLREIEAETSRLQAEMWSAVTKPGLANPTCVMALVVSGMNDVLNAQGYTQAAFWNRIPVGAWILVAVISIFCNLLVGYGAHGRSGFVFLILPIALSVSLFLIADIDGPRRGVIRVQPQNLQALAVSIHSS
jgi:hypothetical protein